MARPKKYATPEEAKEAARASRRNWKQKNKEKIAAYFANYYQDNKDDILAQKADHKQTLSGMCVQKACCYRAKDRRKFGTDEGSVTGEQMQEMIEVQPYCFYCGESDFLKLGLDRIDNSNPHTVENCVVACWNCNNERRRMPFEEFCKIKGVTI